MNSTKTTADVSTIRRAPMASTPKFAGIRRFERHEAAVEVLILDEDGWEIPLRSVNLSPGGLFVRSDYLFEEGAVHTLIFGAPGSEEVVRTRARVIRCEGAGRGVRLRLPAPVVAGMAYEFLADGVDGPAPIERLGQVLSSAG